MSARAAPAHPRQCCWRRAGHRVLLVDKAAFPSDTLSTHYIHQSGVARLKRWGVLEQIVSSCCPPIRDYTLDLGPFALRGTPPPVGEAAARAGAEVRPRFSVQELVTDGRRVVGIRGRAPGGRLVTELARIVIGADGMRSLVARGVDAATYNVRPTLTCAYYSYWSGVAANGIIRDRGG